MFVKFLECSDKNDGIIDYLIENLNTHNIKFEIKEEEKWHTRNAYQRDFYTVLAFYVEEENKDNAMKIVEEYKNAKQETEEIEELSEDNNDDEKKYYHKIKIRQNVFRVFLFLVFLPFIVMLIFAGISGIIEVLKLL